MNTANPISISLVKPVAINVAATVAAAALLVVLGKLIALMGSSLSLKDSCWQLLAVRALAGGAVVSSLLAAKRLGVGGYMWLFGLVYGLALMTSHNGQQLLMAATLGGVLASVLLSVRPTWNLAATLVFMATLTVPALVRKTNVSGWSGAGDWSTDLALRLAVVTAAFMAVAWIAGRMGRRAA